MPNKNKDFTFIALLSTFVLIIVFLFACSDSPSEVAGQGAFVETDAPLPPTPSGGGSPPSPPAPTFTVTMQNDGNGTATATPATAVASTLVTISSMPNIGFEFKEWQVITGTVTPLPNLATSPATFTMPAEDVNIMVKFDALPPGTPSLSIPVITFSAIAYGDLQPVAQTVTISNTGTDTATVASIVLGGTDSGSFTLGGTLTPVIAAGATANFIVQPNAGLNADTYSATITITFDGGMVSGGTAATSVSFTVYRAPGAAVGTPTVNGSPTHNSITVNAVTAPTNGQIVEYAISTTGTVTDFTSLTWQSGAAFSGLSAITTYYIYARSEENTNYETGTPSRSAGITTKLSVEMVWIPAGTFLMGSPLTEPGRSIFSETQHSVTLTSGFYIGRYPVTQAEYQFVMGYNPSYNTTSAGDDPSKRPVEYLTWYDALMFCNKLTEAEIGDNSQNVYELTDISYMGRKINGATVTYNFSKSGYRLPTEAQWEYACRAGKGEAFNWGSNIINATRANYRADTIDANNLVAGTYLARTTEVGLYAENAWGLYDMHGNVMEWCFDFGGGSDYGSGSVTDPIGLSGITRAARGGSCDHEGHYARSASRNNGVPNYGLTYLGFRIVRP